MNTTIAIFDLNNDTELHTYVKLLKELVRSGLTFQVIQDKLHISIELTGGY